MSGTWAAIAASVTHESVGPGPGSGVIARRWSDRNQPSNPASSVSLAMLSWAAKVAPFCGSVKMTSRM